MSESEYWDDTDGIEGVADNENVRSAVSELITLVLSAVKNAFIYGYRVRFLHTLAYQVATIKTHNGIFELLGKIWKSCKMGLDHGKVLASFAIIYRCCLAFVKKIRNTTMKKQLSNHFIAGFIGGVLVYSGTIQKLWLKKRGGNVPGILERMMLLNEMIVAQITMYTMSRLVIAVGRDMSRVFIDKLNTSEKSKKHLTSKISDISWTLTCGLVWGGIMVYYQRDRRDDSKPSKDKQLYLPRALQFSLEFIYGGVSHAWKEAFDYSNR